MFFVAKYPGIADGCRMRWEYFGTGHGKGEMDSPTFSTVVKMGSVI
jgi:hypothetical protein